MSVIEKILPCSNTSHNLSCSSGERCIINETFSFLDTDGAYVHEFEYAYEKNDWQELNFRIGYIEPDYGDNPEDDINITLNQDGRTGVVKNYYGATIGYRVIAEITDSSTGICRAVCEFYCRDERAI